MRKCILLLLCSTLLACEKEYYVLDRFATMRLEELSVPAAARSQDLTTVDFVSATQGFAAGTGGTLLATTDGGQTWQDRSQPTLGNVRKLLFTSATAGWAATSTGLYRTANGGQSWQQAAGNSLRDVQFVTPQIGYAVGEGAQILKTTNGGQSWLSQRQYYWSAIDFRAVSFSAPDSGMVVGNYEARYSTTNGGQTWQREENYIESRGYHAVMKFRRPGHYLLLGICSPGGLLNYSSFLERSPEGDFQPESQNTFTMYGVARWQNRLVAVGENTILRHDPQYSSNPYTPWALVHGADGATILRDFRAVDFADQNTLYAVGPRGLLARLRY